MSVNKYLPHVFVIPEDDRDRQIANGFELEVATKQFKVLEEAGGWSAVLDRFDSDHIQSMERYPARFIVLLIDFDGKAERLQIVRGRIPEHLVARVFVLGSLTTPEKLKADLGALDYEAIGRSVANDCRNDSNAIWTHELLRHNAAEIARLRDQLRPILFGV